MSHAHCTVHGAMKPHCKRMLNKDTLTATNKTQQLINTTSAHQPAVVLQNHPCSWHQHHNHHPAELQPSHTAGMQHDRCQHSATRMRHTQMAQEGIHLLAGAFLHLACTPYTVHTYARSWATPKKNDGALTQLQRFAPELQDNHTVITYSIHGKMPSWAVSPTALNIRSAANHAASGRCLWETQPPPAA